MKTQIPPTDTMVTLRVPASAWATLNETLELDCRSKAFDPALRGEIKSALEQVTELQGAHIIDFGSCENAFASALARLSGEGYSAIINGSKENFSLLKVEEGKKKGDELVVASGEPRGFRVARIPVTAVSFVQV